MSDRFSRSIDKIGAAIAPLFEKEDFALAKSTLVACCEAKRRVRAGKDKETGAYIYEDEPDWMVQLAAAVKIIEWNIGKPVARSVTANLTPLGGIGPGGNPDDLLDLLLSAPDAAADIIAKLKIAAEKAKNAKPIDLPPLPEAPPPSA